MTNRRVLFVAYHFPPVGGGGVQRALKFVRHLPALGYEPVVVTGPGTAFATWTPEDATMVAEVPSSTEILRAKGQEPSEASGWRRRVERLLGRRSQADRWWIDGAISTGRGAEVEFVFGELVPYATADAAAALARELGVPWVADLQDPWALDEMWQYPSILHRRGDLRRMRRLLGSAAAVVMNTPEAAARLLRQFPELAERLVVSIPNGFDAEDFAGPPPPRSDDAFRIVHSGYLHTEFGLRHRRTARRRRLLGGLPVAGVDYLTRSHVYLLEAVNGLLAQDPSLRSKLEVHLVGLLSPADLDVAATCPVVHVHGYRPHSETVALVRSADLLFLPMQDLPLGTRAGLVPGKTYEYLASGNPILAAVPDGDARDLLAEAGSALLCRPSDSAAMAQAIAGEIARQREGLPSRAPNPDVVARYERGRQARDLVEVFDSVLGVRGASGAHKGLEQSV